MNRSRLKAEKPAFEIHRSRRSCQSNQSAAKQEVVTEGQSEWLVSLMSSGLGMTLLKCLGLNVKR